jgi:hypothetical protein
MPVVVMMFFALGGNLTGAYRQHQKQHHQESIPGGHGSLASWANR